MCILLAFLGYFHARLHPGFSWNGKRQQAGTRGATHRIAEGPQHWTWGVQCYVACPTRLELAIFFLVPHIGTYSAFGWTSLDALMPGFILVFPGLRFVGGWVPEG